MSREHAERKAELDIEVVRLEAEERAKRAVQGRRGWRPFAITLCGESDLFQHEVSGEAAEEPATAVEILAFGLRAGTASMSPRAVALARRVVVRNLQGPGETQAVCIALEHADGLAKRWFLPYAREGDKITWHEPTGVRAVPWFFAAVGPGKPLTS